MATSGKNNSSYTYRNGKKVILDKKDDEFVVRTQPATAALIGNVKEVERVSPSSTRVTVDSNVLDKTMNEVRENVTAHHAYTMTENDSEFLITDRIIVTFRKPASPEILNAFISKYALVLRKKYSDTEFLFQLTDNTGMNPVKLVVLITETESELVALCEHDLNRRFSKSSVTLPTDSKYNLQWHLHARTSDPEFDLRSSSNCEDAWKLIGNFGNGDVVVGISDDGCRIDHPDFDSPGKFAQWGYMNGLSLINRDSISADPKKMYQAGADHGTACCGVIGAEVDASLVVGAAPGCKLLPIKWESDDNGLYISDDKLITVLNFITDKVDVFSNSWGLSPSENWTTNVVNKIKSLAITGGRRGKGIVFLWAAGNENCPISHSSTANIPYSSGVEWREDGTPVWVGVKKAKKFEHNLSGIPGVLYVAALASNAQRSHYSNYGTGISLCAPSNNVHEYHRMSVPGLGIMTASGEGNLFDPEFGGTSSATPLVAGIAALVISANPTLTGLQVISVLQRTAQKDLSMTGYSKTPPTSFDPNTAWDVSPVAPFDLGDFTNIGHADGMWSPWFGFGKVDAAKAVAESMQRAPGPQVATSILRSSAPSKQIPDNNTTGVTDTITINEQGIIDLVKIDIDIQHTYIGDLQIVLIAPNGETYSLHNRNGGGTDNLRTTFDSQSVPALTHLKGSNVHGDWKLKVTDLASVDVGTFNSWGLKIDITRQSGTALEDVAGILIPDNDVRGIERVLRSSDPTAIREIEVTLDITHTYIGDLIVNLVSPKGTAVSLHSKSGGAADNIIKTYTFSNTPVLRSLAGQSFSGEWKLQVADLVGQDEGKLNKWSVRLLAG